MNETIIAALFDILDNKNSPYGHRITLVTAADNGDDSMRQSVLNNLHFALARLSVWGGCDKSYDIELYLCDGADRISDSPILRHMRSYEFDDTMCTAAIRLLSRSACGVILWNNDRSLYTYYTGFDPRVAALIDGYNKKLGCK